MTYDRIDGLPDDSDETRSLPGQSISGEPVERPIRGGEVLRQERLGDVADPVGDAICPFSTGRFEFCRRFQGVLSALTQLEAAFRQNV
jgi:hypothetical protein